MTHKQLWLLAGGNGAGKSTFHRLFLAPRGIKLISADLIAKEIDPENTEKLGYKAAYLADRLRDDFIYKGISFCYETVFSHVSKIDFVAKAKALGYEVILVYIHLDTTGLNEARVRQRVTEGGHDVPTGKIHKRIPRTIMNVSAVLPLVDEARLLNNSYRSDPYQQVAIVTKGMRKWTIDPLPKWAENILSQIPP
ncbi:MAG: zeta toxin family protein [Deltaproteobacteria bacterium]|nr:zeta toxin family protein [Deltaproteobacteria bacterium]